MQGQNSDLYISSPISMVTGLKYSTLADEIEVRLHLTTNRNSTNHLSFIVASSEGVNFDNSWHCETSPLMNFIFHFYPKMSYNLPCKANGVLSVEEYQLNSNDVEINLLQDVTQNAKKVTVTNSNAFCGVCHLKLGKYA